jgi:membrane protein involved in colicin uptake
MKTLIGITLAAFLLAPTISRAQAAEVICKDGNTSEGGRGACSGHGGIDKAATEKAVKAAKKKAADEAKAAKKAKADEAKADGDKKAEEVKAAKEAKKQAAAEAKAAKKAKAEEAKGAVEKKGEAAKEKAGAVEKKGEAATEKAESKLAAEKESAKEAREKATKEAHEKLAKPAGAAKEKDDEGKGPPTAKCKDGSMSYSEHHTGACSRHGGVEEWLDGTKEEKK